MRRFVVTFDTSDAEVLEREAPGLLSAQGFSTDVYFPRLGVGVVDGDPEELEAFSGMCRERRRPMSYTPELTYYALTTPPNAGPSASDPSAGPVEAVARSAADSAELTWGLQAIQIRRAQDSGQTGGGMRLAVLDTGFDASHPDFAGRSVTLESFIAGEGPEDVHGHGTHCIGTACGPWVAQSGPGYGVAAGVEVFSGKVLGKDGSGSDTSILAGIDWALQNGCQVISMSLGADVREVHPPYVTAGRRALEQGSLLVAAAGNNAGRAAGDPGFVGAPANSPFVMAVAAVDSALQVADFSARSLPHDGGEVDIAAPGVDIYSSWPRPELFRSISGTSMATPHVSGIAAVLAGATGLRGQELWDELIRTALPLEGLEVADVGAGLATIPALGTAEPVPPGLGDGRPEGTRS
ncbi:S8 family serine peptidase [Nesterenkonia halotolerans]|uniref:Subtilisin family serine protease n=1 Tax=Nesterenkonia halotolerans TaxID=225325 RepID=A0ABR9J9M6_9MICC|nr:S8 family serine peptidase [Nesterenkonia halotolerans]MBE1515702.1 subtilisin family serine protease [Nesterenkonia halotolerans]